MVVPFTVTFMDNPSKSVSMLLVLINPFASVSALGAPVVFIETFMPDNGFPSGSVTKTSMYVSFK